MTTTMAPSGRSDEETRAAALEAQKYTTTRLAATSATTSFRSIPIIDLKPSFSSSLSDRQAVASQIYEACTKVGFFYITGHGMESVCEKTLKLAERFFSELPQESKDAIHLKQSKYHRGYEPASYSSLNGFSIPETKEAFNWGYEKGIYPDGDDSYVELDGSKPDPDANLWPKEEELPGFYKGIAEYYGHIIPLCKHLFKLFALALGLPEDYFAPMTTHPGGIARLIKYKPSLDPKPLSEVDQDKEVGLGAHTDYECFTLLLQSSTPGLEVLSPDGRWVSAAPVPGGIVVNVADFLMRWTNGIFKSTVHRVVNRTDQERYSIPLFFSINYDERVETLPSCVTEENPSKFPPITAGKYVLDRLDLTMSGTGY